MQQLIRRNIARVAWMLAALLLCALAVGTYANAAELQLKTLRTDYLRLIYLGEEYEYVVLHLTRCFENSLRFHRRLFDYTPSEDVTVILQDLDDYGYAGTTTIPYNYLTLGIEPFEHVYETCPTNERINWVMNHELVHVVASDQATGTDRFFRKLFLGKVAPTDDDPVSILYSYLTNPRRYAPRWYHEGLAVFMETWMAGGIGRAQGGYDEMVFRAMVRDSSYFYDIVGIESEGTAKDFQVGQLSYLYGTRFISYAALAHGPQKVIEWAKRDDGSKRYFSSQFANVFGASLEDEWRRWIAWEQQWQQANLDSIRQYPVTPLRSLTRQAVGSVSRSYFDPKSRRLFAAVRYPGEFAHLAAIDIDTGQMQKICDVASPALYYVTSLAYDDSSGTLFFSTNNGRGWRNLRTVDIATGQTRTLVKPSRTGDLAFNRADHSLWGVQHHNGLSRLVRFPPPYDYWHPVFVLSYKEDLYDIDISPDGTYLTGTLVGVSGQAKLIGIDLEKLLAGNATYDVLHEVPKYSPANFVFSDDGRYLYGTSYYTGTSNIFRYDRQDSLMEAISNCETGLFRPVPVAPDSLIAFEYTGQGFVPVMLADTTIEDISAVRYLGRAIEIKHPIVRDWVLESPRTIDPDSVVTFKGEYGGLSSLRLNSMYPVTEGYKDYPTYGLRFDLMDPVGLHALDAAVSYSPNRNLPDGERLHARFNYRHHPWTLNGAYNRADFYDFFGPTKVSRKGYVLGLNYGDFLFEESPKSLKYSLGLNVYAGLERLPDYQNVATSYDNFQTGSASLRYSNLSGTIGGVEAEKGVMGQLAFLGTYVRSKLHARTYASLTYGFLLPIDHSSLWLRTTFGQSFGNRAEPFANFFFGGFGNNWVDHASVNRYRAYYSFPGVELNDIAGKNFVKAMVEWPLPPLRFRRLGIPALYFTWARLSLFSSGIAANFDQGEDWRRRVGNVGAQLNLKLVMFSSLESTFSLGYAVAAEKGFSPHDEVMASLKILR